MVVEKKLQELHRYLEELETCRKISWDELNASLVKQWQICHGLQLSIQTLIDIGNHILAEQGENQVEDYADIIDKLGEKNIIPLEFSRSIRGMAGLRNILVHEYARLDLTKIYSVLQNRLSDFHHFIEYINQYLENYK
jgi:uncharacterized protein YutE (UPF0331/DUF86 family)